MSCAASFEYVGAGQRLRSNTWARDSAYAWWERACTDLVGERCDHRPDAGRREDRGSGRSPAARRASTRRSGVKLRSERSMTGMTRHRASARSIWWRTAARATVWSWLSWVIPNMMWP